MTCFVAPSDSLRCSLQQQWQQRLNRAEALSQQQCDRAQAHASAQEATIMQLRAQINSLSQTVGTLDDSLSKLKAQKASLGHSCGDLQVERQSLMGEGQRLKGQVQQLEASVCSLRQELLQVLAFGVQCEHMTVHVSNHALCVRACVCVCV